MNRCSTALLVSELYPPAIGGTAVLFHNIYSRLAGASVVVLTDGIGDGRADGQPRIVRDRLRTRRWGVMNPRGLAHHIRVAWSIRRLAGAGPALAHCGRALPEGIAALLARQLGGPRYVCWTHGEDLGTTRSSRELTWLTRLVLRGASAVIANSHSTRRMLAAFDVPESKVHVVHPGVDCDRFRPSVDAAPLRRQLLPSGTGLLLLSVGRLQRRKGHDVMIAALDALRDLPELRYVIVGDGDERAHLESLVDQYSQHDRVVFAGSVTEEELPAYYAACDVFVMPNRIDNDDIEGFGIVFLEAAAAGRPAIGGASGGVPEVIDHERTGLLVNGSSPQEVAGAIRRLAESATLRRKMGETARARAAERFGWAAAAERVSQLHRQLTSHG